jgi:hypothetical protein
MRAEQPSSTTSSKENIMASPLITVKQTITVTHNVEALPVDAASADDITAFLSGTGYHYSTAGAKDYPWLGLVGMVVKTGMARIGDDMDVRPGYFLVKVDGKVEEPCDPRTFTERYNK